MPKKQSAVDELRESFRSGWIPTIKFIDWAASHAVTPIETATVELAQTLKLKNSDAKDLFEGIKNLRLAEFIVGRRRSPSRFKWLYSLASISAVARGHADQFDPVSRLPGGASGNVEHVLHRRGRKFVLQVPNDFSTSDAKWLSEILPKLADDFDE
jgi:hypothetical protein